MSSDDADNPPTNNHSDMDDREWMIIGLPLLKAPKKTGKG
jgi:hypothetical protein